MGGARLTNSFLRIFAYGVVPAVLIGLFVVQVGLREDAPVLRERAEVGAFDADFFQLTAVEIAALPFAVRFDHPLGGAAAGAFAYDAQPFLTLNEERGGRHSGADLNGIGGGDSDLGDPVRAAGVGRVMYAGEPSPGWGNVVILAHRVRPGVGAGPERVIQTVYAHLERIDVARGQVVRRGEQLGTVGTAGGRLEAHLHFEVREHLGRGLGGGYLVGAEGRHDPVLFLARNRGASPELLTRDLGWERRVPVGE
jgi:murein DD-endopeptidase MepM/ murein hydrolase activator NlpD